METTTVSKKTGQSNNKVIIAAVIVMLVVVIAAAAVVVTLGNKDDSSNSVIGYATEAQVLLTQEDIDAAAAQAQANAENGNVSLLYKDNAYSNDGKNFSCYIVNSANNQFDMFLTIYSDLQLTDELFLSQLIPPGSGFESITLEHSLEEGDHMVYVVVTQVKNDEETGEEVIANQVIHTMDFHVGDNF
jgi:hypothetical protein